MKINQRKTEMMTLNISNPIPVKVNGEDLSTTEEFTYLGSTACMTGTTTEEVATSEIASTRPGMLFDC